MALTSSAEEYSCRLPVALTASEFSDLTIRCRSNDHAVHKVIVCSQSKVFRAACVNNCMESTSAIIDLSEDDPETIAHLVTFLYTSVYPVADSSLLQLSLDVSMYIAADKYDIPSLSAAAKQSLSHTLDSDLRLSKLRIYGEVGDPSIEETVDRFVDIVLKICDSTLDSDRGLRDIVMKYAAINGLLMKEECSERFRQLILDVPDFAWDLMGQLFDEAQVARDLQMQGQEVWSQRSTDGDVEADPEAKDKTLLEWRYPRSSWNNPSTSYAGW